MIKGLLFDAKGEANYEPTAWGDYRNVYDMLSDFEDMARKSLPINGAPYTTQEFTAKVIDKKTRKSIEKYSIVVSLMPTLAGVRAESKTTKL